MRKCGIIVALWLATTSAALAQDTGPAPGLPNFPVRSMSQFATDREDADALIATTGHPELFENVTEYRGPAVLHRASGMTCGFIPNARSNGIKIYEISERAEDISCSLFVDGASITQYAYRYTPPADPEQQTHEAIAAIRERFPDLKAYEGQVVNLSVEGFERPRTYVSRAVVSIDGVDHLTKVMVSQIGEWTLKQRMTVRLDRALDGDSWSETLMLRAIMAVSERQTPPQA